MNITKISVGTPVTLLFFGGKQLMFARGEWEPTYTLKGMLNPIQLEDVLHSTLGALKLGAEEIYITF